ncbi:hypothetical protein D3C84_566270 [compost metagenome]
MVFDLADFECRVALEHAIEHLPEARGIAPEHIGRLLGIFIAGQHRVDRAEDAFGEQRLALGHGHLGGRCTALQKDLDHFLVFDLQLRHGFGQGRGHLVQREHGLFAGEDRVGVFQQTLPVQLHGAHLRAYRRRSWRQAGAGVAFLQVPPASGKVVARITEQLERGGLARGGFRGILGDTLGQHPQFAGMADVLFVVGGLRVEVGEVGEQQHDEHNQRDEQRNDLRATA